MRKLKPLMLIISLFAVSACMAQKTYLAIYTDAAEFGVIMYPPGTPYQLYDSNEKLVFDETDFEGTFNIEEPHTLYVFPSWKEDKDEFELTEGRIEVYITREYFENNIKHSPITTRDITVSKTLYESVERPGKKNVRLEFSNGIIFTYTDGQAKAFLDDKPLKIESRYLVYSELGVTKISFNPRTGVTWWVFEAKH